jgi:hypothetical protein
MADLTTRAGKGSPLTNDEVDANFTNLNTDKLETAGGAVTGDITFGDNDKAIFGAGSDLQIYHDSASNHSIIAESGSGSLFIRGQAITMQNADGSKAYFGGNGDVATAYYGTSAKLATTATGIDVTGTVTADGLTVDGTSVLDSEANFSPDTTAANKSLVLASTGATGGSGQLGASVAFSRVNTDSPRAAIVATNTDSNFERMGLSFWTHPNNTPDTMVKRMQIDHIGDISFYEDTGTTPKFFWDASAEALGIGTSSPAFDLDLTRVATGLNDNPTLQVKNSWATEGNNVGFSNKATGLFSSGNGTVVTRIQSRYDSGANIGSVGTTTAHDFLLLTNGAERMRIDSLGNVGIGVIPKAGGTTWQHVQFGGTGNLIARFSDSTVDATFCSNYYVNASNVDSYITTGAAARMYINDNVISFDQAASGTADSAISWSEAMRIDSSGNLLVGTTNSTHHTGSSDQGITLSKTFHGLISASRSGAQPLILNRQTSDGTIADFRKDGTSVGSIGNDTTALTIGSGSTGVKFGSAAVWATTGGSTNANGTKDLGASSVRWKDLYLSGGVYLGGTGAANLLDDYETGTFTPVASGTWTTTPTSLSGRYIKVGNFVWIEVKMTGGVKASSTSGYLTGLPFSTNNSFGGTGAVVDSGVTEHGSCLFQNTDRIWLTDTDFGTGTVYVTGGYEIA